MTVRTRFAPSPTGNLHIGGARTALFAYLWAAHNKGQFIFRAEDTDKVREVPGSMEEQIDGIAWLGITPDEGPLVGGPNGPYVQSERLQLYRDAAEQLVEQGNAFYCFATKEELEEMRARQREQKLPPRYDLDYRDLPIEDARKRIANGDSYVIRLKVPKEGSITVHDVVRGDITFELKDVDDQVLLKSDGYPTYHLAVVVDDHAMGITHVIRGEEWIPSTPKHVLLYQYFGWDAPAFVHLTVFLSKSGGKMSKRDGETALKQFRNEGFLSEAIVNYVSFLGWNPKSTEEFFTLEELVERFDIADINTANPVFDREKLLWMNQQYLRKYSIADALELMKKEQEHTSHADLYERCIAYFESLPEDRATSIWSALTERASTLVEIAEVVKWLDTPEYDPAELVWKKSTPEGTAQALVALIDYLNTQDSVLRSDLEQTTIDWISDSEWGNGDILWPMRFALSGEKRSPSPFELAEILGMEEVQRRLATALEQVSGLKE